VIKNILLANPPGLAMMVFNDTAWRHHGAGGIFDEHSQGED
jgi:hypothetical protein